MNHDRLRALFEDALGDEPADAGLVDDDVARGRALRTRRMRRRAGAVGVGAATLVTAALVVPASPISLVDGGAVGSRAASISPDGAALSPEVANDPVLRELWGAVEGVLPEDVDLVEDSSVSPSSYVEPNLELWLERDERRFSVHIWLQPTRPDLERFRPCSDPHPALSGILASRACEEGEDAQGRWRVSTRLEGPPGGVTILEDDVASVVIEWDELPEEGGYEDDPLADSIVTADEVDVIADAAHSVGAEHPEALVENGFDMTAILDVWPEMHDTLEEILDLGELTPVRVDDGRVKDSSYDARTGTLSAIDPEWNSGSIAARYTTDEGVEVDVIVWQTDRLYDVYCHDRIDTCAWLNMGISRSDDSPSYAATGPGPLGALASRSGLSVTVGTGELVNRNDPDDVELDQKVASAQVELLLMVPFLGEDPAPAPSRDVGGRG